MEVLRKPTSACLYALLPLFLIQSMTWIRVLFLSPSKKYAIEKQDGEKIVARKRGFTVDTCVSSIEASKDSPNQPREKVWGDKSICIGLVRTLHIRCGHGIFGREVQIYRRIPGGRSLCNFWTACTNPGKNSILGFLSFRAFNWYMYGSNPWRWGRGGSPKGNPSFFGGVSGFFLGYFLRIKNIWTESWAQAQSIGTLNFVNLVKGGVCGHGHKSEARALGCRPQGVRSQRSSLSLQTCRIVSTWDAQWNAEERKAIWGHAR